jgi:cytochrome b561
MGFRYNAAARWLHWITAALIVVIAVLGVWMKSFEPADQAFKLQLYNWHESFGILVFLLVIVRLVVRNANPPEPLPADVSPLIRFGAHANHVALYAVLLVQPIIGFLGTNAWGFPLEWFGLIPIPSPIGKQPEEIARQFTAAHWWTAMILAGLLTAHLAGVVYHGLIRRDGLVRRMI